MKEKRYYGDPRFYKLLERIAEIHSSKNHDYAGKKNPLQNFRMCESMGIPAWKGVLIRISDKFSRACNFAKQNSLKVKDENVVDTLLDMAIYSLLCAILYEEREKNDTSV